MKTLPKISLALLILGIAYSCKNADNSENANSTTDYVTEATDDKSVISSNAAVEPKKTNRKFIRTADFQYKVKDVAQTTYNIEKTTSKIGGFVTFTELKSTVNDKSETRVSQDSILETTKFTVENNITIRVPNTKLDTLLTSFRKEVAFLDFRIIKADDVSLQLLSNKITQKRSSSTEKRVEKAIDDKGKKLNQIIDAEDNLASKKEANDAKTLENLSMNDQVNFSTVNIRLYQREEIKNELYASEKNINKYRPHLGLQIWDSLKTGWFMLEGIIAFVVQLWALFLILFLAWIGYKKFKKIKLIS
ncbi:DUF4349 domain-containing protein [Flavobacterium sp.]|uniref:DUF4349 domain-containing protein n=1 Tax=Flavobacterium sp. TaxID=239 RepID=UPI003752CA57